jgi:TolB-like protein/DNA-binding winged helix-turn-helix (wHTH) protein/Tfp pilus assembly protein PilF
MVYTDLPAIAASWREPLISPGFAGGRIGHRVLALTEGGSRSGFFVGDRFVEPARNRVTHGEDCVALEPKAMAVLIYLARRAGEVVSGEEILRDLWPDTIVNDGSVYWYIARVRRALGDSPRDQQVIETVPKKGYALRAPVFAEPSTPLRRDGQGPAITAVSLPGDGLSLVDGLAERHSVAVLPMSDVSGTGAAFCQGLTEELRHVLSAARGLRVAGPISTANIRDRHLDPRVIGRLLDVTHVVDGAVRRDGDRLRVSARLVDSRDGAVCWSEIYEHGARDTFEIEQRIAAAVADALRVSLLPIHESELASSYTHDPDAWEFFMLGRHEWTYRSGHGPEKALHWFEKAAARDPNFALAQVGIASVHAVLPWYRQADRDACLGAAATAADRALALAPDLADAHAVMGFIAMNYELDGTAAMRWMESSLELKPSCAQARHWYADLLNALGRHADGLEQARLAARIEPLSALFQLRIARILSDADRSEEATPAYHRALELDPLHPVIHALCGLHFLRIGDLDRAQRRLERWADLDREVAPGLGEIVHRGMTRPSERARAVARVLSLGKPYGVAPMVKAGLLLQLDALEEAARTIHDIAAAGLLCLPWAMVLPGMARLADDPRIAALRRPGQLPAPPGSRAGDRAAPQGKIP